MRRLINKKLRATLIRDKNPIKYLKKLYITEEQISEQAASEIMVHSTEELRNGLLEQITEQTHQKIVDKTPELEISPTETSLFLYISCSKECWKLNQELEDLEAHLGKVKNRRKAVRLTQKIEKLLLTTKILMKNENLDKFENHTLDDLLMAFGDLEKEIEITKKQYESTKERNIRSKIAQKKVDQDYEKWDVVSKAIEDETQEKIEEKMRALERIRLRNEEIENKINIMRQNISEIERKSAT